MMNLADLNNYCLLNIMDYLNTEDKLRLWKATEPTTRLADITSYSWRRRTNHHIDLNHFTDLELLNTFLSIICSTVVEVHLTMGDDREPQLNVFRRHIFSKARILTIIVKIVYEFEMRTSIDWEIGVLADCFPNIERLLVDGENCTPTGRNFSKWNRLTHLHVVKASEYWTTHNFWVVCDSAKNITALSIDFDDEYTLKATPYVEAICSLKNLEQLWIKATNINKENALKLLTELPKLCIFCCNEIGQNWAPLRSLLETRAHDVLSITLSDFWMCYSPDDIQPDTDDTEARAQYSQVLKHFKRLEAIHLKRTNMCGTGNHFWDLIYLCPQLKMISVMLVDMSFYQSSILNINRALHHRTQPLNFHVQDTSQKHLITDMLTRPDLKLTFGPLSKQQHVFDNFCIEFELFPIAS
ncbi:hypothetical protein KR026_005064 [Drosophila bipectinata]|nr:hypothetical protein KR026_005064 [Drosophila bipectinata]